MVSLGPNELTDVYSFGHQTLVRETNMILLEVIRLSSVILFAALQSHGCGDFVDECRPQHLYNVVYFCLETLLILTSSLHVWILLHNMKLEVSVTPSISTMWCTFVLKHCSSWRHLYMSGYCYTTWNWRWVLAPASLQCSVLLSWNTAHLDVISTCLDAATQHETGGECWPQHLYNVVYFCLETLLILTSSLHVWMLLHNMKLEVSAGPSISTMWCTFVLKHCSSWRHLYTSGYCYITWNWRWVTPPASLQCSVLLSWNTAHLDVISTCLDTATQHETGGECRPSISTMWCTFVLKHCSSWRHLYMSGYCYTTWNWRWVPAQHLYNVVYFCLETLLILTSSLHVWILLHNMKL